jgi:DNA-binding transcriptional regulator YiaG
MMRRKYKSELYQVIHEEALANFKVGAISEEQMHYFESRCFVQDDVSAIAVSQSATSARPLPAYASQH